MDIRTDRSRVKGFLRVEGKKLLNEDNEEVILAGIGLGNWLLPEGYMWLNHGGRFDRPRNIAQAIRELTGTEYSEKFWKTFRDTFVARDDIKAIADYGFNSVRIPFNWTILMEDEPGVTFIEEGFALIDRCLDWCEEFSLYAVLDLHGAPGGQTGSNIDDSIDNMPRLFIDADSRTKAIALWEELAKRYRNRAIVAAYDLLNEPLRTDLPGKPNVDYLHPELARFYEDCTAAIRKHDTVHPLSIEGGHWASSPSIFYKSYDPQMIIHFHRYGVMPGEEAYTEWLAIADRLNAPVWLGESGENMLPWFTALYPLGISLGVGYNFWTWKKMETENSPLSIKKPEGWDKILDYVKDGPRPSYEESQRIFDDYLRNIRFDRCVKKDDVVAAIMRKAPCTVMATDFDTGTDACSGKRARANMYNYRAAAGMYIRPRTGMIYKRGHGFLCGWETLCLELAQGEWASYSIHAATEATRLQIAGQAMNPATIKIAFDNGTEAQEHVVGGGSFTLAMATGSGERVRVTIACTEGAVELHELKFDAD